MKDEKNYEIMKVTFSDGDQVVHETLETHESSVDYTMTKTLNFLWKTTSNNKFELISSSSQDNKI